MESSASDIYMSTQVKIMRLFGTWPYVKDTKLWKKMTAKTLFYLMLSIKLVTMVSVFHHIYTEWGHLPDPIDNAIVLSALFNTTFGMLYIPFKIRQFQNLMKIIDKRFIVPNNNSQKTYYKIFKNYKTLSIISSQLIFVSAASTIISYCIAPFLSKMGDGTYSLPFQASFPFDITTGRNYWIAYVLLETCVLAISVNGTINCDFMVTFIIKTTCQFSFLHQMIMDIKNEVIKKKVENLQEKNTKKVSHKYISSVERNDDSKNIEILQKNDDYLIQRLNDCIKFHQEILGFVRDLEEQISPFMLSQMCVYMILLSTNVFRLSTVPIFSREFFSTIPVIMTMLALLLMFSWHGNELKLQGMEVAEAAYNCDWLNAPQSFKKSLMMLIMRAQKPVKLTAWKFSTVDLTMFIAVMKATYSYYQVLHETYNNQNHK